jgi:threonine dehydratase
LRSGQRETVAKNAASICDALLTPSPGEMTFPINQALLSGGLAVSDEQVKAAMRFAFETLKLVIEPGGAVALAAVLHGLAPAARLATAVVVSGANVDPELYAAILSGR